MKAIYIILCFYLLMPDGAYSAPQCGESDMVQNKRPAIPFQPIPMIDPETGRPYHPNDSITIEIDGQSKSFKAADYFRELNALEESLNRWGYSIRTSGEYSLSGWSQCLDIWEAQAQQVKKAIRAELAKFLLEEEDWDKVWQKVLEEYQANRPSWEEIYRLAEEGSYRVEMPEIPAFSIVKPTLSRKPIAFHKEKSWPWEGGDRNKTYIAFNPYVKFGANKTEAKGEAGLNIDGSLAGQWSGNISSANIHAISPGTGPMRVDFQASIIDGKKVWNKPLVNVGSLRFEDEIRHGLAKSVSYYFQLGPIPMSAEFGLRGEMGLQYGLDLYPLQIGSYVQPYTTADAYAQAAADIYVASVGVGGQLRLIEVAVPIQGHVDFEWIEEPIIQLQLSSTADLSMLAGELYAFAKINYLISSWKGKHSFFKWEGFQKKGSIIDYKASYSRAGLVAEGDLSPRDLLEKDYLNRLAALEALEEQAADKSHQVLTAISKDLQSAAAIEVGRKRELVLGLARAHDHAVHNYYQELGKWLE